MVVWGDVLSECVCREETVICQLHPPIYLYSVGLGCVVAVYASSFVRG